MQMQIIPKYKLLNHLISHHHQQILLSRAVYFVEDKWQKATYLKFCVEGIRKELWKV